VTRQGEGGVGWTEEHFVVFVHDVYQTKKHGRVIEFYAEQGGYRVVPLNAISMPKAGRRNIERAQKAESRAPRKSDKARKATETIRTRNRQHSR
jgi:hypothetical protein